MQRIKVTAAVGGTTVTDIYTATESSCTMAGVYSSYASVIQLKDGRDAQNNSVKAALYRQADRIIVWEE